MFASAGFPLQQAHHDRNRLPNAQCFQGREQVGGTGNRAARHRNQLVTKFEARRLQGPLFPGLARDRFVKHHGLFEEAADKGILQPAIRREQGHDKDDGRQDLINQDNGLCGCAPDGIELIRLIYLLKGFRKQIWIGAYLINEPVY